MTTVPSPLEEHAPMTVTAPSSPVPSDAPSAVPARQIVPPEDRYAAELAFLAAYDDGPRPPAWRLTPRAVVTFVMGSEGRALKLPDDARTPEGAPRRMTVSFAAPVDTDPAAVPGISVVMSEPLLWVIDVHGPAGPLMSSLKGLPVADLTMTPFTLDETILRLLGEQR